MRDAGKYKRHRRCARVSEIFRGIYQGITRNYSSVYGGIVPAGPCSALNIFHCHGPQMRATQVTYLWRRRRRTDLYFSGHDQRAPTGWPAFAGHDTFVWGAVRRTPIHLSGTFCAGPNSGRASGPTRGAHRPAPANGGAGVGSRGRQSMAGSPRILKRSIITVSVL